MFKMKVWFWSLGLFFLLTYCVFILWNIAAGNPVYIRLLETFLPGFKWLSPGRFIVGAVESFLYGAYIAVVFVPIHNFYYRMHHPEEIVLSKSGSGPSNIESDLRQPPVHLQQG